MQLKPQHTPESLRAFERQIAEDFNAGKIRAPVHLAGGNEEELIKLFHKVKENDWVLTQWRSHYHCLLKGVPPEQLRDDILEGRSITLCYEQQRIISSAIVGGILPIAVGIAWAIKRAGSNEKVWVFIGDMTSSTGMFWECANYAGGHNLPMRFVTEDNRKSVCTPTQLVWGKRTDPSNDIYFEHIYYDLPWPHSGAGKRVEF